MITVSRDEFGDLEAEVSVSQFNAFQQLVSSARVVLRTTVTHRWLNSEGSFKKVELDTPFAHQIITEYFTLEGAKYASSISITTNTFYIESPEFDDQSLGRIHNKYILHKEDLSWLKKNSEDNSVSPPPPPTEEQILREFLNTELKP